MERSVLQQVTELTGMPYKAMKERWRSLYGTEPPAYKREHMIRRLAYRIQELAYGGLSEKAKAHVIGILKTWPQNELSSLAHWPPRHTENHDLMHLTIGTFAESVTQRDLLAFGQRVAIGDPVGVSQFDCLLCGVEADYVGRFVQDRRLLRAEPDVGRRAGRQRSTPPRAAAGRRSRPASAGAHAPTRQSQPTNRPCQSPRPATLRDAPVPRVGPSFTTMHVSCMTPGTQRPETLAG